MIYLGDNMTKKQEEIYNAIVAFIQEKGYSPTVREIGKMVNLKSPSTVHVHLMMLEAEGYITSEPGKQRTIRVVM